MANLRLTIKYGDHLDILAFAFSFAFLFVCLISWLLSKSLVVIPTRKELILTMIILYRLFDNASLNIISFKLLGTQNYRKWKSFIYRVLRARNKPGFVD